MKYYLLTWLIITDRQTEFADRLPEKMKDIAQNLFHVFADATLSYRIKKAGKILEEADKYIFINDENATCYLFQTKDGAILGPLTKDPYVYIHEIGKEQYDAGDPNLHLHMMSSFVQEAKPASP